MKKKLLLLASVLAIMLLLFSGCAGPNGSENVANPDGSTASFWSGLWQGIIAPIAFIISWFTDNVNVYEVHNNGFWYNLGFLFGLSIIFGSGARASRRRRSD
jgi:amino acid permease